MGTLIKREGSQPGSVAISLPESMAPIAEQICDHLGALYPKVTIRVIVNHCLQPEIVRADRVDDAPVKALIGSLRQTSVTPHEWHLKIAKCIGEPVEDVAKFSFRALHDRVRGKDHKLAAQLDRWLAGNQGDDPTCAVCSEPVSAAEQTTSNGSAVHTRCVPAPPAQLAFAGDAALALATKAAFLSHPDIAHAHVLAALSDAGVKAVAMLVLSGRA